MKKVIFIIALAFLTVSVMAQDNATKTKEKPQKAKTVSPEDRATKISGRLQTELKLTDEQTGKVKQATLTRINQLTAAKTKAGDDKKAFGQERKKIFQTWETELKGILTADQYKKYLAKKEEKKKKMQENKAKKSGTTEEEDDETGE